MERVWVLGGYGFIGRHVCAVLAAEGHEVFACSARGPAGQGASKAFWEGRRAYVRTVHIPAYNELKPEPGDVCIHLAESKLVGGGGDDPSMTAAYPDSSRLLHRIANAGFSRVIYASSAAVYGDRSQATLSETTTTDPSSEYGRSKLQNEVLLREMLPTTILRLSNTFGPGMSTRNVLSEVIEQARRGTVVYVNDSTPVRDYIFVSDVARAFAAAVKANVAGVFNIATGTGTSVAELATLIGRIAGHPAIKVVSRSVKEDGYLPSHVVLSSKLAGELLQWHPLVVLSDGLNFLMGKGD